MRAGARLSRGRWGFQVALVVVGVAGLVVKFVLDSAELLHLSGAASLRWNVGAAVVAAAGVVVGVVDRLGTQRREQQAATQRLLDLGPARSGRLWRIREISPYQIGVSRSRYAGRHDPYVARTVDAQLDQALRDHRLVLLVGASKAGKSRTAFEAVRRVWPEAALLVPKATPGSLRELFGPASPVKLARGPVVVWLDDLDRFLHPDGLDGALLDRLSQHRPRVVLAATIVALRRQRLHGSVEEVGVGWQARQVLARATEVVLPSDLTGPERERATKAYPDESFEHAGIGEQLAAVELLIGKYRADQDTARPAGWAVVQAAVDWRRVGMARPIPEPLLHELSQAYLRDARVNLNPTDNDFTEGLGWALAPAVSRVALLERVDDAQGGRGYQVLDFLVAVCDGQDGSPPSPVREATWPFVFEHVPAAEVLHVGFTAYSRGLRDLAADAWAKVTTSGEQAAGEAAFDLGVLLAGQGDAVGAETAWQLAVDSHHPRYGPLAHIRLGLLLDERGDLDGAIAAWQQAARATDRDVVGDASALLTEAAQATAEWLVEIEPSELARPLSLARTRAARQVRAVAWVAWEHLASGLRSERAWQLELAARILGADQLADQLAALVPDRPWVTRWARAAVSPHFRLTGHSGPVTAVAVAEVEGRPVVVLASSEGTVGVWNLASGELPHQLGGHSDEVTAVAVAEVEGRPVVVSASDDKTVGVWDLASGELRHRLTGHSGPVTAVAVAGVEGRPVVVSASFDKTVRVWTGMQSWICEQTNMFGAMITSSVITPPGIIILGSSDGLLLALSKRPSATTRR